MPNIMGDVTPDEMYEAAVRDVIRIFERKARALDKDGKFILTKEERRALQVCKDAVKYDKEFA